MIATSSWATTFESDHIFFKTQESCLVAKSRIAAKLETEKINHIATCEEL